MVFFGESVARPLVEQAMSEVERGDGFWWWSSLTVWSGYRFVLAASRLGIPITIVNLGATRGDAQAWMKIDAECGELLSTIAVERVSFGP